MINAVGIDGPAGAGKSTVAKDVAAKLNFLYVDTGAMYRAVAYSASRQGVDLENPDAVGEVAANISLSFNDDGTKISVDGVDVSKDIRTPEVTGITRFAARSPAVREALLMQQQAIASSRPVVMEGRDITTVVLKDARWKFLLTASAEIRAERRFLEFKEKGHDVDYEVLLQEIMDRDASDQAVGPLKDAMEIAYSDSPEIALLDTTEMNPEQAIEKIVSTVKRDMS